MWERTKRAGWARAGICGAVAMSVLGATSALGAPFTPGNLAIYRTGDGTTAVTTAAAPVFIDEYTPAGVLVQSIALPTTTVGSQIRLTAQGNARLEGLLNLSTSGQYLILTGYDKAVGGTAPASDTAAVTPRIVGRIDPNGNVDTSTVLNDSDIGSGSPRSAMSDNGTNIWVATASGGPRYTTLGATGSTQLNSTQLDGRHIDIFGGQLYASSSSSTTGVFAIGTGLPTTSGQAINNQTGVVSGAGTNTGTGGTGAGTGQFFFADLDAGVAGVDTLYVVGDGNGAAMRKYSLVSGTWTSNDIIGDSNDADTVNDENYRGLTALVNGTTVTLYAIRHGVGDTLDELVTVTDSTGYNVAWSNPVGGPTVLASAGANKQFKGLDFVPVPEPSSLALLGLGGLVALRRWRAA